jgi:hypothetical protein
MSTAETAIAPMPGWPALRSWTIMWRQAAGGAMASAPLTALASFDPASAAVATSP